MNHLSFPHKGKAGCVRVPLSSPLWADSVSFTRDTYQFRSVPYSVHCFLLWGYFILPQYASILFSLLFFAYAL